MADYTQQGLYQEGNSLFDDIFAFGDLEVQNINVVGIITAKTFSGVDATSLKDDGGTVKIQATSTGATHSGRAVFNEVELQGKVYDSDGDFGTSGQVLSSDGTDIEWVNAGSLTAGAAAEVGVTAVNTNASHFITFVDSSSGNENIRVDTDLTYNPSTNTLGGTNISSLYVTGNLRIGGQLKDGDNAFGSSGQVLSSDGTDTKWVNAGSLTAGAASEVGITAVNDNASHFLAFLDSSSGNDNVKVDTNLTYNPSTNLLSVSGISFSGTISGGTSVSATNLSGNLTGAIQTAAQTNITSLGTLTSLTVDDITINGSTISDAGDLTVDVGGDITIDVDNWSVNDTNAGVPSYMNETADFDEVFYRIKNNSGTVVDHGTIVINYTTSTFNNTTRAGQVQCNETTTGANNLATEAHTIEIVLVYRNNATT